MYIPHGLGTTSPLVSSLASAITRQENVNPAYNNPGGLIAAPGCTSRPDAIAICPDAATGQAALERQIQLYIDRGYNLSDMIGKWAPAACPGSLCVGNNPSVYAQNVSAWTGLPLDVPLSQLPVSGGTSGSWDSGGDFGICELGAGGACNPLEASVMPWHEPWFPWAVGFLLAGIVLWEVAAS